MVVSIMNIIMRIINKITRRIDVEITRKKWRKNNKHNYTKVGNFEKDILNSNKVKVGKMTYGELNVIGFDNDDEKLEIGNYCSIAGNVNFLLSGEHNYKTISTYPFKVKLNLQESETFTKGKIVIEDDVWIGQNVTILSGVKIGKGAVIGACTLVSKDVPPYAIYVNGQVIKYRFEQEIIDELLKLDFTKLDLDNIKNNIEDVYTELTKENYKDIINKMLGENHAV